MPWTLDRYLLRQIFPPLGLALLLFTFVLQVPPLMELAERLIAKGVPWPTILRLLVTLLPQALAVTIPMAVLLGLLLAFGRLSSDREIVALQACGVSLYRMAVPVAIVSLTATAATAWVMVVATPEANQRFREITYGIVAARAETEVKPRVFFEDFPNLVLYTRDVPIAGTGWKDVFLADIRDPAQVAVFVAKAGHVVLDREAHRVDVVLERGELHRITASEMDEYEVERFEHLRLGLDPDAVFPREGIERGYSEMSISALRTEAASLESVGLSPHAPIMEIQKKFSIPVACLVFGLLGLGLGVTSRKDSRQSSFVIGVAVIFAYYVLMYQSEAMAKGALLPAPLAMWMPNIVLGALGLVLLVWRSHSVERRIQWPRWTGRFRPVRREPQRISVASPGQRGGTVVVIRFPQLRLPRPNLLDWYATRQYLRHFGLAFVGMIGIFYIATFIDVSDKLFKGEVTGATLLEFLWYSTPQFVYFVIPIAALVATLVTIGVLTKTNELVVMQACGISLYRAAMPLLLAGVCWSATLFALENSILANANREAESLRHVIRGGSPRTFDVINRKWLLNPDGDIYHYQFFDPARAELNGLSVFDIDADQWRLARRVFASRADFVDGAWRARDGWIREFGPGAGVARFDPFSARELPLESPDYFRIEQPDAERMTYAQLRNYVDELRVSGFNVVPYEVALHRKLSFPVVVIIMTLIAVPFAVSTGSRGALFGVGVGIVLAILYWFVFSVFAAIGTGGLLPPALAAWAPNLLFGAAAAYLILAVRT